MQRTWRRTARREGGYSLVVLVMVIAIMNIAIAAMLPLWSQEIRREKEEELIFRGLQYAEAIRVFHNRFQRWPTRLEELVEIKPRSIRQLWKDPMTEDGKWQLIFEGRENLPIDVPPPEGSTGSLGPRQPQSKPAEINQPGAGGLDQQGTSFGPIKGVYSRSTRKSILIWGGRQKYSEWRFNTDLLNIGQRPPIAPGAGLPPGLNQPITPVRWIGRPWRNFGGSNVPIGPEPVLHPGGGPVSTPGAPGVPRQPPPLSGAGGSQPPPGKPPF